MRFYYYYCVRVCLCVNIQWKRAFKKYTEFSQFYAIQFSDFSPNFNAMRNFFSARKIWNKQIWHNTFDAVVVVVGQFKVFNEYCYYVHFVTVTSFRKPRHFGPNTIYHHYSENGTVPFRFFPSSSSSSLFVFRFFFSSLLLISFRFLLMSFYICRDCIYLFAEIDGGRKQKTKIKVINRKMWPVYACKVHLLSTDGIFCVMLFFSLFELLWSDEKKNPKNCVQ